MSVRHMKSGGVFETTHINTSTALLHESIESAVCMYIIQYSPLTVLHWCLYVMLYVQ